MPIHIGKRLVRLDFHIIEAEGGIILGLPALIKFRTNLTFDERGIGVTINKQILHSVHKNKAIQLVLLNKEKINIKKKQTKKINFLVLNSDKDVNINGQEIIVQAHNTSNGLLLPCICKVEDGKCTALIRNTTSKTIKMKANQSMGVGKIYLENDYQLHEVNETNLIEWYIRDRKESKIPNRNAENNLEFYHNKPRVRRVKTNSTMMIDNDDLMELNELPLQIFKYQIIGHFHPLKK